jgi:CBS domain-containing protein
MKARDLMTGNPEAVVPDDTVRRAAEIMRDRNVGSVPVVADREGMRLRGIVTDRDLAIRCLADGRLEGCLVSDVMTSSGLGTVTPEADRGEVMELMKRDQVRRIPVVEDGDRLVGIIAQADLAVRLGPREPREVESVLERISEPGRRRR